MSVNEKLISAVEKEFILYKKTEAGYYNKNLKKIAWKRVSSKIGLELHRCKTQWRHLRLQYVLEMKAMKNSSKGKTEWTHFETMKFLEPHIHKRPAPKAINPKDNLHNMNGSPGFVPPAVNIEAPNQNLSDSTMDSTSLPSTSNQTPQREVAIDDDFLELRMFCEIVLQAVKCEKNEIESFFQNMANIVIAENPSSLKFLNLRAKLTSLLLEEIEKGE